MAKNYGFLIVEILLTLFLGIVLFGLLIKIYLGFKSKMEVGEIVARSQENLRFAAALLRQNISMAGFAGIMQLQHLEIHNNTAWDFSLANSVRGYNNLVILPAYLRGKVTKNTDVIVIQKADGDPTKLLANVTAGSMKIQVQQNPVIEGNNRLFIADCCHADLMDVHSSTDHAIYFGNALANSYLKENTVVARFMELAFFISDTGRKDKHGSKIYGLYMIENRGKKHELLEGINFMQIAYGVDSYYQANEILDPTLWSRVNIVRITLGLQSSSELQLPKVNIYIKLRERHV
jgi:Tfp pilus assembly protein PilW